MTQGFVGDLTIFVLALLVGFEVISKVPATLHTPLMSGANSIHGVVLVGVVILSAFVDGPFGYVLTLRGGRVRRGERRRRLRGHRPDAADVPQTPDPGRAEAAKDADSERFENAVRLASLFGAVCFVLGLHLMNSPATARRGNQLSAFGMLVAIIAVLVSTSATAAP